MEMRSAVNRNKEYIERNQSHLEVIVTEIICGVCTYCIVNYFKASKKFGVILIMRVCFGMVECGLV